MTRLRLDEFRDWPEGKGPIEFVKAVAVFALGLVAIFGWTFVFAAVR